ncbi:hypothetical protein [Aureliella helgolandensis]|uniref:Uncharacterized protein n=1 Tax=Aureliella helgolandensis TaxID=2527968 RepID=A0A518GFQ2_9BACT|nr:hypothetical protein [Aureliella helgolandensis]QDV27378.1 hypothetical protein Q31a_57670 [Aureliella helgolandensis]
MQGTVNGKLEADRFQRNVKEGGELSSPISNLVEKQSELEAALQDF